MNQISVDGTNFIREGEPFFIKGFNYWNSLSPGSDPETEDWSVFLNYDTSVVDGELGQMAKAGANTIRVWFAYSDQCWTDDHHLSAEGKRLLDHFLNRCEYHGVYVLLTVGGKGSMWGRKRSLGRLPVDNPALLYTDRTIEDCFCKDLQTLIAEGELGSRNVLMGIDLANEPKFGISSIGSAPSAAWGGSENMDFDTSVRIPSARQAWHRWIVDKYGSSKEACIACEKKPEEENGMVGPVHAEDLIKDGLYRRRAIDYQCFVHGCFNNHTARMRKMIKELAPHILVTIGFGWGGTGAFFEGGSEREIPHILTLTQNVREMQENMDFSCVHCYSGTTKERLAFLRAFTGDSRPLMLEEFGYILNMVDRNTGVESPEEQEEQRRHWETMLYGIHETGYAGALGCQWCDTSNPDPVRNTWSRMGIVTRDGGKKPACSVFEKWAREIKEPINVPVETIKYDPGQFLNHVEAMSKLFVTYQKEHLV